MSTPRTAVTLRPLWGRFAANLVSTAACGVVPPLAALYWLTIPTGDWPTVAGITAVTVAVVGVCALAVRSRLIRVDEDGVRTRGWTGRITTLASGEIGSVLVVDVLSASSMRSTPQVFVLDRSGRTALRLRGQYWSKDALARFEQAIDAPVRRAPGPVTRRDFRLSWRRNLSAAERHPRLVVVGLAAAGAAVAVPVLSALDAIL